jgi:hypothetical protein
VFACDPDLAFASSLELSLHHPRILNRGSDYLAPIISKWILRRRTPCQFRILFGMFHCTKRLVMPAA